MSQISHVAWLLRHGRIRRANEEFCAWANRIIDKYHHYKVYIEDCSIVGHDIYIILEGAVPYNLIRELADGLRELGHRLQFRFDDVIVENRDKPYTIRLSISHRVRLIP